MLHDENNEAAAYIKAVTYFSMSKLRVPCFISTIHMISRIVNSPTKWCVWNNILIFHKRTLGV